MKNRLQSILLAAFLVLSVCIQAQTVKAGLFFEQSGDYVIIPDNPAYSFGNGPFTVEMWVQADTSQLTVPFLLHKKDTIINATGWAMTLGTSGKLTLELAGNPYGPGFGGGVPNLQDGKCHHVAFRREVDGVSDSVRAYIDGVLIKKSIKSAPDVDVTYAADMVIGWIRGGIGKETCTYHGMIKELRLWNVIRSESEIVASMDKFLTGSESGLVGNWRFNDNSGTSVKDKSSVQNDGSFASGHEPEWQDFCDVINDVLPPDGVEELNAGQVVVYPNPAGNYLTFKLDAGKQISRLRIYNALGSVVLENINPGKSLDVSGLHKGLYFYDLRLTNNEVVKNSFMKD